MAFTFRLNGAKVGLELLRLLREAEHGHMHSDAVDRVEVIREGVNLKFAVKSANGEVKTLKAFGEGTLESPATSTKLFNLVNGEWAEEPARREIWRAQKAAQKPVQKPASIQAQSRPGTGAFKMGARI